MLVKISFICCHNPDRWKRNAVMDSPAPTLTSMVMGALQWMAHPIWCAAAQDRSGMTLHPVSRNESSITIMSIYVLRPVICFCNCYQLSTALNPHFFTVSRFWTM